MRSLLILVAILAVASAAPKKCRGTVIDEFKQEAEVLHTVDLKYKDPFQLAIDYERDTLFFSLSLNSTEADSVTAKLNLKTKEFETIPVNGGFANAVDAKNNIVYIGGVDGIYKYDYETKKTEAIGSTEDMSIWQMFYKDALYFTVHSDSENVAYVMKDDKPVRVPEVENINVTLIALDNNDNIYFNNATGLYVREKTNGEITYIGDYSLQGITANKNGHIHFATLEGLYRIREVKMAELLTSFEYIYGMAIEADGNIIYASNTEVIRLKPTDVSCPKKKSDLRLF